MLNNVNDKNFFNYLLENIDDVQIELKDDWEDKNNKFIFVNICKDGFRWKCDGSFLIKKEYIKDYIKYNENGYLQTYCNLLFKDNDEKINFIKNVLKNAENFIKFDEMPLGGGGYNGYIKFLKKLR